MNTNKNERSQRDTNSNEVKEENLPPTRDVKDSSICSDLQSNAPVESPKAPEEQVENQSTAQDSSLSSTNPFQPEASNERSREEEQGSEAKPIEVLRTEQRSSRKATGPRTAQGKARSKKNSLKHGLFFKEVLLPGEKRSEYLSLLNGLRDDRQPRGTIECIEVEKLAVIMWHERRFPRIEKAEILKNMEFSKYRLILRLYVDLFPDWQAKVISEGLFAHCNNPLFLLQAKQTLMQLRMMSFTEEFKENSILIKQLYGEDPSRFRRRFLAYIREAKVVETYGDKSSERELSKIRVAFVDSEIERLKELEKIIEAVWYKPLIAIIPSEERCNLLWRYETHFDRLKDRIVKRLERLQRMRKGQPPPPQFDVDIS